jgi:O-antigen/teichoic acid export membrane protein
MTEKPAHGIARNTAYNLAGSILPIVVTLVTVPLYLHQVGQARYGVLAIMWLILGYFSIFDMGLSRATSNLTAKLRDGHAEERQRLFWTAVSMNAVFGIAGGACFWLLGDLLLGDVIKMPSELRLEVLTTVPWIAIAIPVLTVVGVFTGTLEGNNHFLAINIISTLGSIMFALVPLAVALMWSSSLLWLIPAAVITRVIFAIPLFIAALHTLPNRRVSRPSKLLARTLLGYGGWVMVTNILGPILETADRLLIGSVLGVSAVTDYSIPFNLADRLRIIPAALSRTLFSHLSTLVEQPAKQATRTGVRMLGKVMTLVICLGIFGIHLFISVWINPHFAEKAAPLGEILLLGVWINGVAFLPFSLLQSQGRPDIVARFHAFEFIPFLGILWLSMYWFGLPGAAMAWTLRVVIDAGLLFAAAGLTRAILSDLWPAVLAMGLSLILAASLPDYSLLKWGLGVVLMASLASWVWKTEPKLRQMVIGSRYFPRRIAG